MNIDQSSGRNRSRGRPHTSARCLIASVLFLLGLRGLSHSETARRGMKLAAARNVHCRSGHTPGQKDRKLRMDPRRSRCRNGDRGSDGPVDPHDQDARANRAFACFRRPCGRAGRRGRIFQSRYGPQRLSTSGPSALKCCWERSRFTGSLMAFGKLMGVLPGRPQTFPGQNAINLSVLAVALVILSVHAGQTRPADAILILSLL